MFFDIGIGIILAWLTSVIFNIELSWNLVLLGATFSLLPDLDVLFHLKSGKNLGSHRGHDHRDLWHYPLVYIPIGTAIFAIFSIQLAFLFAAISLIHFLHDSIGIGWGIQWLYPFSQRHFSFLYHYDVYRNKLPKKIVYSWSHFEAGELSDMYGDRNWIKNIYLKWHPYAIVELLVFILAIALLVYLKS